MSFLEYIPTPYELSERALEMANSENLIEVYANYGVATNADGVRSTTLCLQAWYRKPGQTDNNLENADCVSVVGNMKDCEKAFGRFGEKIHSMVRAYKQVA